ncbi:Hypothetical protein CAP_4763 [Chondromyces apiculatus DSM 436]|uniref:Uncharacterized protein n=1 Tax=Chondromyces apiculatus DSM 436 TaxID=1192034 RepID=A0A017T6S7_9BACT|nr:Hypothetical protein CAP_4763 [Chondromyces apiculatus DSM 436]
MEQGASAGAAPRESILKLRSMVVAGLAVGLMAPGCGGDEEPSSRGSRRCWGR